jgi:hypothetical protein
MSRPGTVSAELDVPSEIPALVTQLLLKSEVS